MTRRPRGDERSGTPPLLVPPAAIGAALLVVPAVALLVRAPWSKLGPIYGKYQFWVALRISIVTSLEVTAISLVFGMPLAWVLARAPFPGKAVLRAAVTLPLVLPPVVGGVALFYALGRNGIVGQYLDDWFADLPSPSPASSWPQTFVSMPFLVVTVEGAFRIADRGARGGRGTLGASRWRIFTPRHAAARSCRRSSPGSVLCWARASASSARPRSSAATSPASTLTMPIAGAPRVPGQRRPRRRDRAEPAADGGRDRGARRAARQVAACRRRRREPAFRRRRSRAAGSRLRRVDLRVAPGRGASPCSARTGPARRRCCARSPGCCRSTRGDDHARRAPSSTTPARTSSCRPSSAASASCSRTTGCSRTCACSTTWPSGCASRGVAEAQARAEAHGVDRPAGPHRARRPAAAPVVRRAGAARRARPGPRRDAERAAARRAARRPRRADPRRGAGRAARAPRRLRRPDPARHPRPGRGAGAGRRGSSCSRTARSCSRARPAEISSRPVTAYVARLVGMNLYRGTAPRGYGAAGRRRLGRRPPTRRTARCWSRSARRRSPSTTRHRRPAARATCWTGTLRTLAPLGDRVRLSRGRRPAPFSST